MGGAGSAGERCMALPIAVVVSVTTPPINWIAKLEAADRAAARRAGLAAGGEENEMRRWCRPPTRKRCWVTSIWAEEGATCGRRRTTKRCHPEGYYVGGTLFSTM
ncbi:hypothetical protein M8494_30830 [Serratia ureilytica]